MRELLIRGGAALGMILGLWWALNRSAPAQPASCETPGAKDIGECFNDALIASVLPYAIAMAVGLSVGAALGWLISRMLVGKSQQETAVRSRPGRGSSARWITARYAGMCRRCGASINVGDRILHRPNHTLCGGCG